MVDLKKVYKYSQSHKDELPPFVFRYNDDYDRIEMIEMYAQDGEEIAELDDDGTLMTYIDRYREAPYGTLLEDRCEQYQYDYDLNDPHDVLLALIDVTYNVLAELANKAIEKRDYVFSTIHTWHSSMHM